MTDQTPAPVAEQVAAPAVQEPSTPSTEVKQNEQAETGKEQAKPPEEEFVPRKRVDRMRAALGTTERQLQEEKRLREAAEKRIADYEAKTNPLADKPNPDNFEDHEKYTDALADWKLAQKEKAKEEKAKEPNVDEIVAQKLKEKEVETSFRAKEQEFRKQNPGYDRATGVVNGLLKHVDPNHPSTQAFSSVLLNSPNPPALVHYLGTHPDVAIELMQMSPFEIQDRLGTIIDELDAPKPPQDGPEEEPAEALPVPPNPVQTGTSKPRKTPAQIMNDPKASGKDLLKAVEGLTRRG